MQIFKFININDYSNSTNFLNSLNQLIAKSEYYQQSKFVADFSLIQVFHEIRNENLFRSSEVALKRSTI